MRHAVVYFAPGWEFTEPFSAKLGACRCEEMWQRLDRSSSSVASGIYFYRIEAKSLTSDRTLTTVTNMILMK